MRSITHYDALVLFSALHSLRPSSFSLNGQAQELQSRRTRTSSIDGFDGRRVIVIAAARPRLDDGRGLALSLVESHLLPHEQVGERELLAPYHRWSLRVGGPRE